MELTWTQLLWIPWIVAALGAVWLWFMRKRQEERCRCQITQGEHDWEVLVSCDTYSLFMHVTSGPPKPLGDEVKWYHQRVCLACGQVEDTLTPEIQRLQRVLGSREVRQAKARKLAEQMGVRVL